MFDSFMKKGKLTKAKKFNAKRIACSFNPLPDDKILDRSKLKQISGDILKCKKTLCEERRNCLLQAISPFLTMFSTAIYL